MLKEFILIFVAFNFAQSARVQLDLSLEKSGKVQKSYKFDSLLSVNNANSEEILSVDITWSSNQNSPDVDQELKDKTEFEAFRSKYGKKYKSLQEKEERFQIFKQNLRKIEKLNADKHDFATYGINKFTDQTFEFCVPPLNVSNGRPSVQFKRSYRKKKNVKDDDSFDWRDNNAVASVKNQGTCNTCWAFSAIEVVEGQYGIKNGGAIDLSEQELVDCISTCDPYYPEKALQKIKELGGVETYQSYPYVNEVDACNAESDKFVVNVDQITHVGTNDEDQIKDYLEKNGPLSVVVNAEGLHGYTSGIINQDCSTSTNHAVLLVGYGVEDDIPYWTVKNSWGGDWGENGYFKIYRGNNMCGIAQYILSATIA